MKTRRAFVRITAGSLAYATGYARDDIAIGCQSFSFRDRAFAAAINAMREIGFSRCEVYFRHLEPELQREDLRKWRTTVHLSHFAAARRQLDDAGIQLDSYYYAMYGDMSDEELSRGFEMAKALGVECISTSTVLTSVGRIDELARRAKIRLGLHNHSNLRPNQMATPESFETALAGRSEYLNITLDIGHLTAAGYDVIEFIERHHARILRLHVKDRKKNNGPDMPLGQGDTPVGEALRLVRDRNYRIPAYIEYERQGSDAAVGVRKALEYCRASLSE
jgi:sugar phosphate isomerase/epimerase